MSARCGVDVGGTKIQTVVVDEGNKVLGESRHPTPQEGGPPAVAAEIAQALREAAEQAGIAPGKLSGIGVGSPGEIDVRKGTVSQARNLPSWDGSFGLAKALGDDLGVKRVKLGNDVNVATNAEFVLGAAEEFLSLLGVFWGTGVGGGIVLAGKPWQGRGAAGEIGHVVVKRNGARCGCGRLGCMEAYAGRAMMEARARKLHFDDGEKTDLFKLMEKRGRTRLTSGVWERALDQGDGMAERLIDRAITALGVGVASSCNVLDVEAVVIGGGLGVRLGERYLGAFRKEFDKHLFASEQPPEIRMASLGDLGGAIGAALLVS